MKPFAYWNEARKVPSKMEKLQGRRSKEVVVRRESKANGEGGSERCNNLFWFHLGNCPRNLGLNGKCSSIPDDWRFLWLIFALLISKSWDGCKTVKSQACTQCNLPLLPICHFEIFQSSLLLTLNLIVVWSSHLGVFCPGICQVPRLRQLLSLSTLLSTLICLASIQYNGWGKPFGLKYWSCNMWYYVILQRKTSSIKNI